jgi:hypothetical protein
MISFLCLFSICGVPWVLAIFVFFWYIVIKIIAQYKPTPRVIKYHQTMTESYRLDYIIYREFDVKVISPLDYFHATGTAFFLLILVLASSILKLRLVLQLSIWGAFLWNLVMCEIQLYACNKWWEIESLYGEDC